jgi:hypothetical protein
VLAVTVSSCKKDEEPSPLKLVSLVAGDIDLNGAASPNTVPVSPTIVATFNTDVDAATATAANIMLTQEYDGQNIELAFVASGKTITITTASSLGNGQKPDLQTLLLPALSQPLVPLYLQARLHTGILRIMQMTRLVHLIPLHPIL